MSRDNDHEPMWDYFRYFMKAYDSWANPNSPEWSPAPPGMQDLIESLKKIGDGPVLDLASGRGRFLSYLNRGDVVGLDISMNSLKVAKRMTAMEMVNADARYPPSREGAFGAVISFFSLAWVIPLDDTILYKVSRLLKPSGSFIFTITLKNKVLFSVPFFLALGSAILRRNKHLLKAMALLTTAGNAKRKSKPYFEIVRMTPIGKSTVVEARRRKEE